MAGRRREASGHPHYPRTLRVNALLKEVLADSIERLADSDDSLALLTITGVEVSGDMHQAVVYLARLDQQAMEALERVRPSLQADLAAQVRLRWTPRLRFRLDPSVEAGARVEQIVARLHSKTEANDVLDNGNRGRVPLRGEATWQAAKQDGGFLLVDKPEGWTSHDVVAYLRKRIGERRIGHSGTLDPPATGLLLLAVGRATRLMRYLSSLDKAYAATIQLGRTTTTGDATGDTVEDFDMSGLREEDIKAAARGLVGRMEQLPPMVSAVKVRGRKLYELARQGLEVERKAREVEILRLDVLEVFDTGTASPRVRADVECSSGTYIRALAESLGEALGGGAHLGMLRRTRVGPFSVSDALAPQAISPDRLLSPARVLSFLEPVTVDGELLRSVSNGVRVTRSRLGVEGAGPWALLDRDAKLVAVYEPVGEEQAGPGVVLGSQGAA
jgi:tRNA pseudouridine55 synthase